MRHKIYNLLKIKVLSYDELMILCDDDIIFVLIKTLYDYINDTDSMDYIKNLKKTLINLLSDEYKNINVIIKELNILLHKIYDSDIINKSEVISNIQSINDLFLSVKKIIDSHDQFEFIYSIIFDIKNISYLRQILNLYPYYINLQDKDGNHIFIKLIENLIISCDPIYIDSVIHEFISKPKFKLSNKEYIYVSKLLKLEILKQDSKLDFYKSILSSLENNEITVENMDSLNKKYDIKNGFSILERSEINMPRDYIITIDSESTLDMDDALSIKDCGDYYNLKVYIARVDTYIKENSHLDKEALRRSETIYLSDQIIPMLPVELSNNIISLNNLSNKSVFVYEVKVYKDGTVGDFKIYSDYIMVDKKCSYKEVDGILSKPSDDTLSKTLLNLSDMALILKSKNPDKTLYRVIEDTLKKDIYYNKNEYQKRTNSEIIVEESMILVNRLTAELFSNLNYPFIYRCHTTPDNTENYSKLLDLKNTVDKNYVDKQKYIKLLDSLSKMYPKAYYTINNIGHFGLYLNYYSHCTSPIRRYPDILQQRLLTNYILSTPNRENDNYYKEQIIKVSEYCNKRMQENLLYEKEYERIKTFIK